MFRFPSLVLFRLSVIVSRVEREVQGGTYEVENAIFCDKDFSKQAVVVIITMTPKIMSDVEITSSWLCVFPGRVQSVRNDEMGGAEEKIKQSNSGKIFAPPPPSPGGTLMPV